MALPPPGLPLKTVVRTQLQLKNTKDDTVSGQLPSSPQHPVDGTREADSQPLRGLKALREVQPPPSNSLPLL